MKSIEPGEPLKFSRYATKRTVRRLKDDLCDMGLSANDLDRRFQMWLRHQVAIHRPLPATHDEMLRAELAWLMQLKDNCEKDA